MTSIVAFRSDDSAEAAAAPTGPKSGMSHTLSATFAAPVVELFSRLRRECPVITTMLPASPNPHCR